jgi:hypothetical protein
MADQAIDIIRVSEIKGFIFPAISYVATGAARPVGRQGDTKAINEILLPHFIIAKPVPVPGFHEILINPVMTEQTGFSNFLRGGKRAFNEFRMILLCIYSHAEH